jgi:hypothetical protein
MKIIRVWFPTKYGWVVGFGGGEFPVGRCGADNVLLPSEHCYEVSPNAVQDGWLVKVQCIEVRKKEIVAGLT